MTRSAIAWGLGCAGLSADMVPAAAAPPAVTVPTDANAFEGGQAGGAFGFLDNLQRSSFLLGDMWGLRTALSQYDLSLGVLETSGLLGNLLGIAMKLDGTGFYYDKDDGNTLLEAIR
jgi:porin